MSKDDKACSHGDEEGYAFEYKRDAPWLPQDKKEHKETKKNRHIIDNPVDVHYRQIVEQEVAYGVTGLGGGVEARYAIDVEARYEHDQAHQCGLGKL